MFIVIMVNTFPVLAQLFEMRDFADLYYDGFCITEVHAMCLIYSIFDNYFCLKKKTAKCDSSNAIQLLIYLQQKL